MIPAGTTEHGGDTVNDEQVPIMYCDKHQNPTHFCCERCDTPICPLCMVFGPLGQQCSDDNCDRRLQAKQRKYGGSPAPMVSRAILRDRARQRSHGGSPDPESTQATPATMLADTGYEGSPAPESTQRETSSRGCGGCAAIVVFAAIGIAVFFFYDELREFTRQFTDSEYSQASAPTPNTQATVTAGIEATVQAVTSSGATPLPASAAISSPTSARTSVPTPISTTAVVRPSATPLPASAAISSPTSARTSVPTPIPTTAVVRPSERHIELKHYVLDLINDERAKAGVDPVVLGDNNAAQLHAESSLANCFLSAWGVDGLKHYMRYSLAGGYQSLDGARYALGYCITASDRYRAIDIREEILEWINDTDSGDKILDPLDKRVNIGLAWDTYNLRIVLQLEGDYVEYARLPTIENGILAVSGTVKNGAGFAGERDLGVQIYYDQPPQPLTRGQLTRTSCTDNGLQIAALRRPLSGNRFYTSHEITKTRRNCPDPYEVPADAPVPKSHDEARALRPTFSASLPLSYTVPWITALEWTTSSDAFAVRADISDLLARHGNGVYSITVWGVIDGEDVVISRYSIFHGVTPPDTYDPSRYD